DGFADIVMKDSGDNQFFVLLGDGDGTFEASATYSGAGYMLEGGDVNNNGSLDLMIADFQNDQALLSLNNGLGVYPGPSDFAVGTQPRDVHLADFNHDGAIDFLTSNLGSQNLTLYLNQSDTQGPTGTITYDGGNGAGADFTLNVEGDNVIPLTGTATDVDTGGSEVTLVEVSINGGVDWENAVDTGGGTPWSTWSYLATLVDGQNQVRIRITDAIPNVTTYSTNTIPTDGTDGAQDIDYLFLTIEEVDDFVFGTTAVNVIVSEDSVLGIRTNSQTGYQVQVKKQNVDPDTTIMSGATTFPDLTDWSSVGVGNGEIWANLSTKGLGFRLMSTGDAAAYNSDYWGTDDTAPNAKFGGFPNSYETIINDPAAKSSAGAPYDSQLQIQLEADMSVPPGS